MTLRITPPAPFSPLTPMAYPVRSLSLYKTFFVSAPMQDRPVRVAVMAAIASVASVATAIML